LLEEKNHYEFTEAIKMIIFNDNNIKEEESICLKNKKIEEHNLSKDDEDMELIYKEIQRLLNEKINDQK